MIKAVIFDFNGVVYDSTPYIWKARNQYLESYNIKISDEEISEMLGMPLKKQLEIINKKYNLNLNKEYFSNETREIMYKLMVEDKVKHNPGLLKFIKELKKYNIKFGIATFMPKKMVEQDLKLLGLENEFLINSTLEDLYDEVSDTKLLLIQSKKLNAEANECLFIDDSIKGIEEAHALGMKTIYIVTRFSPKDYPKADLIINSFEELNFEAIKIL